MTGCTCCGDPAARTEQHHVDEQRGNNEPDNLTDRCVRCHHARAHENGRRVDGYTQEKFGPMSPSLGPPGGR
jgi:coenzyme F420-reducing hydrogenase beta subunit